MIELAPTDFPKNTDLFQDLNQAVLPRAVLEGINPGWVFVDRRRAPTFALIGLPCGYFYGVGRPPGAAELPGLAELTRDDLVGRSIAAGNHGFIFSFGAEAWQAGLPDLLPGIAPLRIFRRGFHFDRLLFPSIERGLDPLPPGFCAERIDARALAALPELRAELACNWRCEADYLRDGLGVVITRGEELVSYCLSDFACRAALEISVATAPAYRRQGYARQAACAFLGLCLEAGKRPNWECFWDNLPSVGLALSLGFSIDQDWPAYYWEESPPVQP